MKRIKNILLCLSWLACCMPDYLQYWLKCGNIKKAQEKILKRIMANKTMSQAGREMGFTASDTVLDYQKKVKLTSYDNYEAAIKKIMAGRNGVLTDAPVIMVEPTGGSLGGSKYIPYTKYLLREFQRGLHPWLVDLYLHNPGMISKTAYWSVSQAKLSQAADSVLPIGFSDDCEYLGGMERYFLRNIMAVPSEVAYISDRESFEYIAGLFLVKARDLGFISIWSPTFIDSLFGSARESLKDYIIDLETGRFNKPLKILPALKVQLEKKLGRQRDRAKELIKAINFESDDKTVYERIWPRVETISCWLDGDSRLYVEHIKSYFPKAKISGKGLVATEGIVSFPFGKHRGYALAVNSHFYEFINQDAGGRKICLAHELVKDKQYEVVITTGGGLSRYRLGDIVKVVGHAGQLPLLEFIGKQQNTSDRFGEKISELFVRAITDGICASYGLTPDFFLVAPELNSVDDAICYVLYLECGGDFSYDQISIDWEAGLRKNYHYDLCRKLGQLKPAEVKLISGGLKKYIYRCLERGQKLGDIKIKVLDREVGWSKYF